MGFLQSRQFRSGSYSGAYVLTFVGILAILNWLGVQYNETFDATSQKLYSLSGQTHKVLDGLDRDVNLLYFSRTSDFQRAEDMLRRYENASSRVSVEYVDPDEDPDRAEVMNIRAYDTLLLIIGGERREVASTSEQDITNAIITALKGQEKTACVATGHGESASGDMEREGFSNARTLIEDANYAYEDVSLAADGVPADCSVLVVAGPQTAYFDPEVEALRGYVEDGGRLLAMLSPAFPDQRGRREEPNPQLVAMLASWGIDMGDDLVIDESAIGQLFGGGPVSPLVTNYRYHAIVEPMENVATLFPLARSVREAEEVPDGWTVDELLETSAASFATSTVTLEGEAMRLGSEDDRTEGPIPLAVAASFDVPLEAAEDENGEAAGLSADEDAVPEGRVVAVGSSGFAGNRGLGLGGNQDLFLNMLNWLTSDEDLISIRPRDPDSTPIDMTSAEMWRIMLGSIVLLPLVIIVTGVWTWWDRR